MRSGSKLSASGCGLRVWGAGFSGGFSLKGVGFRVDRRPILSLNLAILGGLPPCGKQEFWPTLLWEFLFFKLIILSS